jgi:hypothetical protein
MVGIASVVVTFLLVAPARPRFPTPTKWAMLLALGGLGFLALAADSPLTLVLLWAALDLIEAGLLLARTEGGIGSLQVPYAFTLRIGSIGLVLLAFVLVEPGSAGARFADLQSPIALWLLPAAALLRLCAFAVPWPRVLGAGSDDVASLLQLTAGAVAVGFLSQLQAAPGELSLLIPCALAALYAGWLFLRAPDLHEARPLWIMGLGTLALAASLLGSPVGAAGWSVAILLIGAPLLANGMSDRWARRTLLLGLWVASALPFSLTAAAWSASGSNWVWMIPFFLAGQAMLLAGTIHHALRSPSGSAMRMEVAALRGLQYAAIGLPLVVGFVLGLWGWPGAMQIGAPLAGLIVIPLTAALAWAKRRLPQLNPGPTEWFPTWLREAATGARRETSRVGGNLQRLAESITRTMEGEAGIMWGLLFLVLFVSLIAGRNR